MHEPSDAALRISLLGGFRVCSGATEIPPSAWKRRKAAAIVKILALQPGHRLHREQMMELLWPEADPDQAANNLHQTLHAARRTLAPLSGPDAPLIILRDQVVQLNPDNPVQVDVEEFEDAAARAHATTEVRDLQRAVAHYGGDLLPDDLYESWAAPRREALRAEYLSLTLTLGQKLEASGDHAEAIAAAHAVIAADAFSEPAHRLLMRAYARSGQRQLALRQFEALAGLLDSELGVAPEPESLQLIDEIRSGTIAATGQKSAEPPAGASAPVQHNLPAPASSFVGRVREKSEVRRMLAQTRLLTLTGPGGCGKTRLSMEVAHDLLGDYLDGVWLIELAALNDPDLLEQVVAGMLDIQEFPGQPVLDSLTATLRDKRALLVLDNCEHLIDACANLAAALLRSAPHLRILATSREPLRIDGEAIWLVPSLSLPDPKREEEPDRLLDYEAVRLFVDRAGQISRGFALTPENAASVAELCYRLDGIPLAIELAAARMRALSAGQLVERLGDRFQLLTSGNRAALSRQHTLRAALDWSYDLLSEPERVLFSRLGMFSGSFQVSAMEALCGRPPLDVGTVLDLLTSLVDRSLVVAREEHDIVRFHLLETMREYARARLGESGEADELYSAHAEYYAGLAMSAMDQIYSPDRRLGVRLLEREYDNVRQALEWYWRGAGTERAEQGLALAGTLHWYWHIRGRFSEGVSWITRVLEAAPDRPTAARSKAMSGAGAMAASMAEYTLAHDLLEGATRMAQEIDDQDALGKANIWLAWDELFRGNVERARELHTEGLRLYTWLEDPFGVAMARSGLAFVSAELDEHAAARELFEQSLAMFQEQGEDWGVGVSLHQLANLFYRMGDFEAARARVHEVIKFEELTDYKWLEIQSQSLLVEIARAEGDLQAAALAQQHTHSLTDGAGYRTVNPWNQRNAGFIALASGDLDGAEDLFRDSIRHFQERDMVIGIACCLVGLAGIAVARGHHDLAARLLGAIAGALDPIGVALAPADRAEAARTADAARSALGDEVFERRLAAGHAITLSEAVDSLDL